jgi:hypothetical protein
MTSECRSRKCSCGEWTRTRERSSIPGWTNVRMFGKRSLPSSWPRVRNYSGRVARPDHLLPYVSRLMRRIVRKCVFITCLLIGHKDSFICAFRHRRNTQRESCHFSFKELLSYPHDGEWTPFDTHYCSENLIVPEIEPGTSGSVTRYSDQ